MIDAHCIPETLAYQAEAKDEDHSEWTALVSDGDGSRIYRWKLDPTISFGRENLEHWITRIVQRHGYPVRVQWRRAGGALLHDQPIWGSEDESQEGGFAAAMVPGGFSGGDVDHEATTPIERLVKLFVEQPEVAANAFRMIMEPFFRRGEQRDAELIRLASEHSAKAAGSAAAAAVEQKLAEMAEAAGYELDENGNPIDDLDDELDYDDDDLVDFGLAAIDEDEFDMYESRNLRLIELDAEREKLIELNNEADRAEWEAQINREAEAAAAKARSDALTEQALEAARLETARQPILPGQDLAELEAQETQETQGTTELEPQEEVEVPAVRPVRHIGELLTDGLQQTLLGAAPESSSNPLGKSTPSESSESDEYHTVEVAG